LFIYIETKEKHPNLGSMKQDKKAEIMAIFADMPIHWILGSLVEGYLNGDHNIQIGLYR